MLFRRLISSLILVSLILSLLWLDFYVGQPEILARLGLVLSCMALLLAPYAALELNSLWQETHPSSRDGEGVQPPQSSPAGGMLVFATVLMVVISCLIPAWRVDFNQVSDGLLPPASMGQWSNPFYYSFYGLLAAAVSTFLYEMWRFDGRTAQPGIVASRLGRACLIYVYLSLLFGMLIPHRWLEGQNNLGLLSIVALIATVKLSDSMAFFAGKLLGRIKLAPQLSPKKTVEGAIGSLVGGYAAVWIVFFLVAPYIFGISINKPITWFAIYGLAIVVSGIFGDLAESLLKRDANKKDSSRWLPGLGGVLDVLDSIVFAAPVSYLIWML